ncbi:ROK family transcriptional regulator [Paenibacillus sp. GP183]|uniref:ROK family transcriptional regulator n=1 Tax=Paenibacillus sp. GP183 TaxID=1882751 RepID=UPI00089CE3E4|nr:ROK family transcriptional regulator [Paenibacillus sp. GP183]SEB54487.1 ROK family protein (putative glucokinase) [Paenibacillus sp. GP183]
MKLTGDLNLVKKINTSIVLNHIRSFSPISRARIAEMTGLTKATVSSLVNELIESHLTYEIGAGASSGGRKPMMLLFNSTAGYAVGVDLGVNYIYAALSDLNGALIEDYRIKHDNASQDLVISELKACIREVIARAPKNAYGIVGISIGIPGISDEQGNVLFAPNLRWENVPLQQIIEAEFHIPVVIDNEANAGAVGEKQFGTAKSASNLVYISIGSGIGTGIIIKNELYRGSSGFSGEIGHMSIEHDGLKCVCGNKGCWELYASEKALLDQARHVFGDVKLTLEKLLSMADEGNQRVIELFEQLGNYLSVGVVNIINSLNPEMIVIGGRLAEAQQWLSKPLLKGLKERSLPYPRDQLHVLFSELGIEATVLGACSIAIHAFFAANPSWVELQSYFPT